jgi:hypothetical protein
VRRPTAIWSYAQAKGGKWERFKTTHQFDGTEEHKHWLTSARI